MKVRKNYKPDESRRTGSFYGVVHHDAKEIDESWKNLYTSHSMEDIFGIPNRRGDGVARTWRDFKNE